MSLFSSAVGALQSWRRRQPLRVYIGVVFIVLILITGFIIGVYTQRETTRMLLSAGDVLFERVRQETRLGVANHLQPAETVVSLFSHQRITQSRSMAERLDSVPYMAEALAANPQLSALYVGYDNGDFMLLRPLDNDAFARQMRAPGRARYLLQSVERDEAGRFNGAYRFYDANLSPLAYRADPGYRFDPRTRPWYALARGTEQLVMPEPYVFYSTREPGLTMARRAVHGNAVVAADITLDELSRSLARLKLTPSTELVLLDDKQHVLAYHDTTRRVLATPEGKLRLATLAELRLPAVSRLLRSEAHHGSVELSQGGQGWVGFVEPIEVAGQHFLLAVAVPRDELLSDAERMRRNQLWLVAATILITLPIAWQTGRWIARPLQQLADRARAIESFDFRQPMDAHYRVHEVDELARAMSSMETTISHFLDLSAALAAERHLTPLLERVLEETTHALQASGGVIYLADDDSTHATLSVAHGSLPELPQIVSLNGDEPDALGFAELFADAVKSSRTELACLTDAHTCFAAVPLFNPRHEAVGMIVMFMDPAARSLSDATVGFVEALSGTAAISIEAQRLLDAQKTLLESFIQLVASAIDAKSPYTGSHCQRVPVLTKMLARAACDASTGPFADYTLSSEEWEALHIAAWLHDCGKVTTPEYVVDKATKLETLHDRIHEVRMRFEVLKRDAEIEYWRALANGAEQGPQAERLARMLATLDEEFAFIAHCNVGGESLSDDAIARIAEIARRSWRRTLDDRLGISHDELERKAATPAPALPVDEPLLADRPDHLIARGEHERIAPDNPWGFKLDVPQYKYNRGELYNLSVARGTLSAEERYQINDHIVQTIIMLNHLPFPKHLKSVPELAGGHHEKMDGTGYPKRLTREQMSVPARMMAIADIFEALTAVDRPYKQGKTLTESLTIMARMRDGRHIDAELFALFLESGVYLDYARAYLRPEQIDAVDIGVYLRGPDRPATQPV
ncbi:HD domain-containing phosphohydrolase [Chitinivorax sp. PXF-14]|uniref:HD domain-containing phosphohydrolase n=1 Tax=Chitinivorax sp. PXF-14 TaxID=3230488 RepID=UPI0034671C57